MTKSIAENTKKFNQLQEIIKDLGTRERGKIFYRLNKRKGMSYREIGRLADISGARVGQIVNDYLVNKHEGGETK